MDAHVAFRVYDHGQGRKVPELGDVVYATLVLNHLERRGGSGVVDAQGVRHLRVGRGDCEITSDCEIGGREVSEVVIPGRRREVS